MSSLTLRFLSPLAPGLDAIFDRFRKVLTVEINYSDDAEDPHVPPAFRRRAEVATLLRGATLRDVDCWSRVPGVPLAPGSIERVIRLELESLAPVGA